MDSKNAVATTIDEYICTFPEKVQTLLAQLRHVIQKSAPSATERISYKMPAFYQHGYVVFFAAFKNHIGLYATPNANVAFKKELARYKTGKGSIQFPLNKPLPFELISAIVAYRVGENCKKVEAKKKSLRKSSALVDKKN